MCLQVGRERKKQVTQHNSLQESQKQNQYAVPAAIP